MVIGIVAVLSAILSALICVGAEAFQSLAWLWLLPVGWLGSFLGTLNNVKALDTLPYHIMGITKYEELDIPYPLKGVEPATKKQAMVAKQIILTAYWKEKKKQTA